MTDDETARNLSEARRVYNAAIREVKSAEHILELAENEFHRAMQELERAELAAEEIANG